MYIYINMCIYIHTYRSQGLDLLLEMMHSPDIEISHQSSGVVANLAEATENQGIMVEKEIIQHLKFVIRSKSIDIQREGVRALANISAEFAYAPAIVAAGALLALVTSLSSPDFLCQVHLYIWLLDSLYPYALAI
jgi:hypothetical protein